MMTDVPEWRLKGDWFDVCKCTIPCPCTFAQAPSEGDCEGVLAWHIREGDYGEVSLDGLNVVMVVYFKGNYWIPGEAKDSVVGCFVDERADASQREALRTIFLGEAGGWPAAFPELMQEVRGFEAAPIEFEIADDLAWWRAEIPGKVEARAEALTGPTTPEGARVQVLNSPGSEVGPGQVATWGVATADRANAFGFSFDWAGRSSKHFPFDFSGP
jgi:hypothetical protein